MEPQSTVPAPVPAVSPPVTKPKRLPQSVINALLIMVAAGGVAAVALPKLDFAAGLNSGSPSLISYGGMVVVVILLTTFVLRIAVKAGLGLSQSWLFLAFFYNALIVITKFWLAPASLYLANRHSDFSTLGAGLVQDPNSPWNYVVVGITVGFFYLIVFYFLNLLMQKRLKVPKIGRKGYLLIAAVILIAIATGGAALSFLVIPFFLGGDANAYISYVFSSGIGPLVGGALVVALAAAVMAIRQSVDDEATSGQTVTTASFFALGASLIVIYHILWVIYMISLVSLWPFKTVTPK